ncbi:hypothetical protein [Terrimonas sp.]|uniref:hypothetical protein n=1 Tax=Terrimonas sp. TaxID=1914338 RepID=UPI00197E58FE|nr:hypothetical protein [Terrimonas sp.]
MKNMQIGKRFARVYFVDDVEEFNAWICFEAPFLPDREREGKKWRKYINVNNR